MIRPTLHATLFALALAALSAPCAFAQEAASEAGPEASPESASEACTCTCAACLERHGAVKEEPVPSAAEEVIAEVATVVILEDVAPLEVKPEEGLEEDPAAERSALAPSAPVVPPAVPAAVPADGQDRGILGVQIGASLDGVEVIQVMDGLAAQAAGIQAGDVIFSIAGRTVLDLDELREEMGKFKGGDEISVGVIRNERPLSMDVTLGSAAQVARSTRPNVPAAVQVVPATGDAAEGTVVEGAVAEDNFLDDVEFEGAASGFAFNDFGDAELAPSVGEFVIELPTELPIGAPAPAVAAPAPSTGVDQPQVDVRQRIAAPRPAPLPVVRTGRAVAPRVEYIEIETEIRRERRPVIIGADEAAGDMAHDQHGDLRRELDAMRAEIAELRAQVDRMKREMDRRSLR